MHRTSCILIGGFLIASLSAVSAHVVRGLDSPALATAFVSSPSTGTDAPLRIQWGTSDTSLRVVCFFTANTSLPRVDRPGWPRVTAVGMELPGEASGFALVSPLDGDWELVEDLRAHLPGHGDVSLDFAILARDNPRRRGHGRSVDPRGIPPGQPAVRGSGRRFCVSGPFPDEIVAGQPATIEQFINGVLVTFRGVPGTLQGKDVGVWDNPARVIPLYP